MYLFVPYPVVIYFSYWIVFSQNFNSFGMSAADGFVVQTGDPEGPADGFIDPSTEKARRVPLEIMVKGEKAPFYGATLEVSCLEHLKQ